MNNVAFQWGSYNNIGMRDMSLQRIDSTSMIDSGGTGDRCTTLATCTWHGVNYTRR